MTMFLAIIFSSAASAAYTGQNATNYTIFSNESLNAADIATDAAGNIYVTGSTSNGNYNITSGTYTTNNNPNNTISSGDAYVAKYSSNGTLIFSTVIGGTGSDGGAGISVDSNGNIYVIGTTRSTNLPVTSNTYQTTLSGSADPFIFELSADGTQLLYCTYMGGSDTFSGGNAESGNKIKVDSNGNIYIIGQTKSTDFPTNTTAFQPNGTSVYMKCIVAKFDSNWNKVYSSYLSGNGGDYPYQLLPDSSGNLWITGKTTSSDFVVTDNALMKSYTGVSDAFLTEINPDGTQILYSTYFGSAGNTYGYGMATDSQGNIYITGAYNRNNGAPNSFIPVTPGAYQTTMIGNVNAYVAKFSPNGNLIWCTFYGKGGEDARGITLDSQGNVYITGRTNAVSPLTYNAVQKSIIGGTYDAFVAKFNSNGTALLYGSLLGSSASDFGYGIIADNLSNVYVTGTNFALNKIATTSPPVAKFTTNVTNGTSPLTVQFIDASNNFPTIWAWDFNSDGITDSTEQNPTWTYTTEGLYSVTLSVSSSDGNSTITKTKIIKVGNPDLTVSTLEVPTNPLNGATYNINTTINNTGVSDAGSFVVKLYDNNIQIAKTTISELAAGANTILNFNWTPNTMGNHVLSIITDVNNQINETNRNNNQITQTLNVIASTLPDLTVSNLQLPTNPINGTIHTVNVTVSNTGNSDTGKFVAKLYDNNIQIGKISLSGLAAGASTILNFNWTPTTVGNHILSVIADTNKQINETNRNNNQITKTTTTTASTLPDLTATNLQLPENPVVGTTYTINITIANTGASDITSNFAVKLYDNNTQIQKITVNNLAAGASTILSFNWTPTTNGTHNLSVIADANKQLIETIETNNQITQTIAAT